jgi:cytochrome c-type biogenesis protein
MIGITTGGVLASFTAGIISFLSPCVLPLVPGYVSYVTGQSLRTAVPAKVRLMALGPSISFVLGFSTVFIILGASATALGQLLQSYRYETNLIGGAIVIVFGLLMLGVVGLPWLQRDLRFHLNLPGGRPLSGYLLGVAFAFGWTPCIGPVLGAILTTSAMSATVSQGVLLLGLYSAGLALPFLATSLLLERAAPGLRRLRHAGRYLQIGAGVVMVGIGAAIMTNQLTVFSYWLLDTFPALARIG